MRKTQKNCFSKQKLKFENYKHCLEASHLKNKRNQQKNINLMQIAFEKITKNSQKINRLISKSDQRFINEKHSAFLKKLTKWY